MRGDIDSHYTRTRLEPSDYPTLNGDLTVEVVVIGGGLTGCAAALELAERGRKVALVESHEIGWGASGRNGGFVSEGFPGGYQKLVKRVGLPRAQELQKLARHGHASVRERVARHAIQCGPLQDGALICNLAGREDDLLGIMEFMGRNFGATYEHWPRERVQDALSSPEYSDAMFNPRTFTLHPLNFNLGMARAAREAGAQIFQRTPVTAIVATGPDRGVQTPMGKIRADQIVIACGGYIDGLQPTISSATIPIATFVMATEPLGDKLREAIRVPYAISDNQVGVNYYRALADGRLLWGGRVLAWQPSDARISALLQRDMARFYPALRDAKVEVAWGGYMPFTRHKLPVIGQISPGVWYATGFGGLGLALTGVAGKLIADGIVDADETWKFFEAFGLPLAGGKWGRIPAQIIYWRHGLAQKYLRKAKH